MKLIFRITLYSLGLLAFCFIIAGGYQVYKADQERRSLTDADIKAKTEECAHNDALARAYVEPIRRRGLRTTDPRVFYSPKLNRCLYTYLVINPKLPEATTFNSFLIYDLKKNRKLFLGEGESIKRWDRYLDVIAELEQK